MMTANVFVVSMELMVLFVLVLSTISTSAWNIHTDITSLFRSCVLPVQPSVRYMKLQQRSSYCIRLNLAAKNYDENYTGFVGGGDDGKEKIPIFRLHINEKFELAPNPDRVNELVSWATEAKVTDLW
jgi:hypothetical protein